MHAALWSAGRNEIYIIQASNRIDIINARRPAKVKEDKKTLTLDDENLTLLTLVEEILNEYDRHRFSAHLFGKGTFWEQKEMQAKIAENQSAYYILLDYLMKVRIYFKKNKINLPPKTIDNLLTLSILVKFLEAIKDDNGKHTLKAIYKKYEISTQDFGEAVEKGYCLDIFEELGKELNGKIFNQFSEKEKQAIKKTDLKLLAQFLRADINLTTNQLFIWQQYSFNHLPAEVISAIYENFIQDDILRQKAEKEKGVVYTPIHLVNMLIDETMPLYKAKEYFENKSFKILDPACGSGAFLVAAYKRMLQWWIINNSKNGKVEIISSEVAQSILEKNIFGVDLENIAVLVSILGLTTAMLDQLSPKEIWNNLTLHNLRDKNICEKNFIDWAKENKHEKQQFDLVIGNPPFNDSSKLEDKINQKDLFEAFGIRKVAGNKLAFKFLEGALFFGKKVCMIIPSSIFLYNKASTNHAYRKHILTDYTVKKIYDFTHLRRILFKSVDTPVLALVVDNRPSEHERIEHIVIKRMMQSEEKIRFEIDEYDRHFVPWNWAIDERIQFVWKTNLLGGGRLFHFMYQLSLLRTLDEFIEEQEDWIFRSGYKIGKKKKLADFIDEGHKLTNVFEDGNYDKDSEGEKTNLVESHPPKDFYIPPFIVFDQILGKERIPMAFIEQYENAKYLYFDRDFVGIHAPKKDVKKLKKLYNSINKPLLYSLFVLINSESCLIQTETEINKRDIASLPYPHNPKYLELSKEEQIIQNDVLKYYRHLGKAIKKKGRQKADGEVLHETISKAELETFGNLYCELMNEDDEEYNSVGKSLQKWHAMTTIQTNTFTVFKFGYGKTVNKKTFSFEIQANGIKDEKLRNVIFNNKENKAIRYNRIVRIYEHLDDYDCVILIKPNARRYWLQSIAIADVDKTFMDFKKAGF